MSDEVTAFETTADIGSMNIRVTMIGNPWFCCRRRLQCAGMRRHHAYVARGSDLAHFKISDRMKYGQPGRSLHHVMPANPTYSAD
jgi:hypothetical protein